MLSDATTLLIMLLTAAVPTLALIRRGRDIADPRIVFGCGYALLTGGPVLWYYWSDFYYHGINVEMIPLVLLSCSSAIVAFMLGGSLALRRAYARDKRKPNPSGPHPSREARVVYHLLLVFLFAMIGVYGFAAILLRRGASSFDFKSDVLVSAGGTTLRLYYIAAVAIIIGATALVCYDAVLRNGRTGRIVWVVLGFFALLGLLNGERDVALPVAAWILVNLRYRRFRKIAIVAVGLIVLLAVVPVARQAGYAVNAQIERASEMTMEGMFESLATKTSPNLFVFTKVASWIPRHYDFYYGRTYADALLSFVPWYEPARQRSLLTWFRNEYAPRGVSGYGFAPDAEAYMNFGWLGPPIYFFLWGLLLGALYKPGPPESLTPARMYFSVYPLVISMFSIRADFRGFSKMMVFGLLFVVVMQTAAAMIARSTRLGRRLVTPPVAGPSQPLA
jgi:oligosaccharide repeat unit polymerase